MLEVALHTGGGTLIFDGHTHEQFVDLFHAIGSDPDNRVVILYLVAPKGRIFVLAPVPLVDELPIPAPQITFCARRRARDATKLAHQRCEPALGEGDDGEIGYGPTSALASAELAKAYVAAVKGSQQGVILDLANSEIVAAPLCACEVGGTHIPV